MCALLSFCLVGLQYFFSHFPQALSEATEATVLIVLSPVPTSIVNNHLFLG